MEEDHFEEGNALHHLEREGSSGTMTEFDRQRILKIYGCTQHGMRILKLAPCSQVGWYRV